MKITRLSLCALTLTLLFIGCSGQGGVFYQGPKDDTNLEEQNQEQTEDLGTSGGSLSGPRIGTSGTAEGGGVVGLTRDDTSGGTGLLSGPMGSGMVSGADRRIRSTGMTVPISWKQVAAGKFHTCAIAMDGSLWCWGHYNDPAAPTPAGPVMDKRGITLVDAGRWISLAAGEFHTCAIKEDWTLWCFGDNSHHKLGIDGGYQGAPVQVGGDRYKMVAAGANHTCALKDNDKIACWGGNRYGQGGSSPMGSDILSPKQIYSTLSWSMLSAHGDTSFAVSTDGKLLIWGREIDDTPSHYAPRMKAPQAVDVGVGGAHFCYIRDFDISNNLTCAGSNESGQLGLGVPPESSIRIGTVLSAAGRWQSVVAGEEHTCATESLGGLYCWGDVSKGQIAFNPVPGSVLMQSTPKQITIEEGCTSVAAGNYHSCAISGGSANRLYCWGDNRYGQVGPVDEDLVFNPVRIE